MVVKSEVPQDAGAPEWRLAVSLYTDKCDGVGRKGRKTVVAGEIQETVWGLCASDTGSVNGPFLLYEVGDLFYGVHELVHICRPVVEDVGVGLGLLESDETSGTVHLGKDGSRRDEVGERRLGLVR